MNARDDLAEIIKPAAAHDYWPQEAARLVLAAGWTRPREITTVEELDALPDQTVILSRKGHSFQMDGGRWCNAALTGGCPPAFIPLPATVLHEPQP